MIYNNNDNNDNDDDDDACINDVIQIVTYNFNKFWIFFMSLIELLENTFIFI